MLVGHFQPSGPAPSELLPPHTTQIRLIARFCHVSSSPRVSVRAWRRRKSHLQIFWPLSSEKILVIDDEDKLFVGDEKSARTEAKSSGRGTKEDCVAGTVSGSKMVRKRVRKRQNALCHTHVTRTATRPSHVTTVTATTATSSCPQPPPLKVDIAFHLSNLHRGMLCLPFNMITAYIWFRILIRPNQ